MDTASVDIARVSSEGRQVRIRTMWDRFSVSDPGWTRALSGWQMLVSLTASIAAGYGVARGVGQPEFVGMTVGGLIAFVSALLLPNAPFPALARSFGWVLAAYPIGLLFSVWLSPHRTAALTGVGVAIFLQFYLARFGVAGMSLGAMFFGSYLSGELAPITLQAYPRGLLIAAAAATACLLARAALCWHRPATELRQTGYAFEAACRRTAACAVTALTATERFDAVQGEAVQGEAKQSDRDARRLRDALARVNTIALIFDGRLGHISIDTVMAEHLHRRVFDIEHTMASLMQLCRTLLSTQPTTAQEIVARQVFAEQLEAVAGGHIASGATLRALAEAFGDSAPNAATHRAASVLELAADELDAYQITSRVFAGEVELVAEEQQPRFVAVVALEGSKPAGARPLAGRAAAGASRTWWRGVRRPAPTTVTAIQAVLAVAIAIPLGDAFDSRHFYWAAIGVLVMMMGVSTPHERARKVLSRVGGTVLGAVLGLSAHHLIGNNEPWWTLTVVILALSLANYLFAISYTAFVTFLVTALIQLYAITSANLDRELVHRLAENMLGGVAAVIITLIVLPIATKAVVRVGFRNYLTSLRSFIVNLGRHLTDPEVDSRLRSDSRALDHALFQARQVSTHLVRPPDRLALLSGLPGAANDRHRGLDDLLQGLADTTGNARRIARHAPTARPRSAEVAEAIIQITDTMAASLAALDASMDTAHPEVWTSCGPLIDQLIGELPDSDRDLVPTLTALRELDIRLGVIANALGGVPGLVRTGHHGDGVRSAPRSLPFRARTPVSLTSSDGK